MASEPRKYSVAEIDEMRSATRRLCSRNGEVYYPRDKDAEIENVLRTYMMNGTEPAELWAHVAERQRIEFPTITEQA